MANPVFNNSPVFADPRQQRRGGRPAPSAPTFGGPTVDAASLEAMYDGPTATTRDTGRLTYDDVIIKTGGLLALLVAVAAVTWFVAPGLYIVGAIVGLVLGLVNAFKRKPSPALIVAYTVAEGVFLGGISYVFQNRPIGNLVADAQPIVLQAVLATVATFVASLWLYRSGRVRVTAKSTRFLLIAMIGYALFSLVNVVLMWVLPSTEMFGPLRSGPIGIIVGLFAVGLAAFSLIVDFDAIKRGVEQGAPKSFAWTAAFGLIVTLVWLYLEFLRLFAIFSSSD
ncbi:Bax inhibitor-1/YccA family protein [Cellulomonas shaoxiangyii]|uniref:Bax inhibitor-1/YccA family protein n=1 Tax=Cellulomonas shaoxiangyii TaxID=2566013 RepID=A0A4P7SKV9_9CELL|nr:Bax inhibitor-1/YccA family protein [Cellulomonas shaoxiangyii]QCB94398.1 Bax inhibitor-1/YccA family protein [Cellulomonas shaoxiangyii]TGY84768.1 Bax inhibitor-1/YccA family protein [Cellulomonas shaoxiangyii]